MKLFECIVDDGHDVYKALAAGKSRKAMLEECGGNGEFISIKDVTADYFTPESVSRLNDDLRSLGWGKGERTLICALLQEHLDRTKQI